MRRTSAEIGSTSERRVNLLLTLLHARAPVPYEYLCRMGPFRGAYESGRHSSGSRTFERDKAALVAAGAKIGLVYDEYLDGGRGASSSGYVLSGIEVDPRSGLLSRLLAIPALLALHGPLSLLDLGAMLSVTRETARLSCMTLSMCGRHPMTPDTMIEVHVDDGIASLELDQGLARAVRLVDPGQAVAA